MYKNQSILEGFLGNDPEPRPLPSGDQVVNLSLATKDMWTDDMGQPKESTDWHKLVFYGDRAKRAGGYKKGDNIHIEGKATSRKFTDQQGHEKTVHEIVVFRSHRIDRMIAGEEAEEVPAESESAETAAPAGRKKKGEPRMATF